MPTKVFKGMICLSEHIKRRNKQMKKTSWYFAAEASFWEQKKFRRVNEITKEL